MGGGGFERAVIPRISYALGVSKGVFLFLFLKSILACSIEAMARLWAKPLLALKRGLSKQRS